MSKKENIKTEDKKENLEECVEKENTEELKKDETIEDVKEENESEKQTENEEDNSIKLAEAIVNGLKNENSKLIEENKKITSENEALKDRLSRTVAEYDNFRKRTSKEKEAIYTNACEDILKEMLPVLDNLERAITVDGELEDFKKGIEMTIKQFNDSLEKLEVEEISTDGEFDPNVHNAVMHIEDDNYEKNSIAEVFQKGYKRGDKVLRHSMVKVAN